MKITMVFSLWFYQKLVRAFPDEFRLNHEREMIQDTKHIFRDAARRHGWANLLVMIAQLLLDLAIRVPVEHLYELAQDTHYAMRMLARSKGFTIASIVSIGIGIGLTTTTFSQLESLILRDIPTVGNPDELVSSLRPVSYPDYEHFRDNSGQFSAIAAYIAPVPFVAKTDDLSSRVWGHLVTPNYFDVLQTGAVMGRTFAGPERVQGSPATVVVSHRFWRGRLGGDPDVVGSTLRINGYQVTVIGVAEEDFFGALPVLAAADIWLPTTMDPRIAPELGSDKLRDRDIAVFSVVGRLPPDVTRGQAEAALDAMIRQQEVDAGETDIREGRRITLVVGGRLIPIRDEDLPVMMGFPLILVGVALLIACSNVGTLLLARGSARAKEIAIRLSVGASRAGSSGS